jgi:AraC family transcriptional regulator
MLDAVATRLLVELQGRIVGTRTLTNFTLISSVYSSNQVLPPHSHTHAYVSVALQGSYQERCGRKEWDCASGGSIFHVAGEHHSNRFYDDGARLLVVEIGPRLLAQLREQGLEPESQKAVASPLCMHLALKLQRAVPLSDPLSALSAEGLGLELLSETLRFSGEVDSPRSDWLGSVKEQIHDQFRDPLTLSGLAASASVHPVHLARTFRKRYGCSVGNMIRTLRIDAAFGDLLHSDTSIAQIAMRSGFTDQSHLCRMLKRYAGVSPGQIRKARG